MKNEGKIEVEHPGIILKEEFMDPYGISAYRLTKETGIDKMTLSAILKGKRTISPVTALKISKFFGLSERYWINLQSDYDLRMAKHKIFLELSNIQTISEIQSA